MPHCQLVKLQLKRIEAHRAPLSRNPEMNFQELLRKVESLNSSTSDKHQQEI